MRIVFPQFPQLIRPCWVTFTPTNVWRQCGHVRVGTEGMFSNSFVRGRSVELPPRRLVLPTDISRRSVAREERIAPHRWRLRRTTVQYPA